MFKWSLKGWVGASWKAGCGNDVGTLLQAEITMWRKAGTGGAVDGTISHLVSSPKGSVGQCVAGNQGAQRRR